MLLYYLRGGGGCQNPTNDISDSPGLASHPGLTVTALPRSTVNRRKKKSTACTPMQFHVVLHPNAAIHRQQKEKNRRSVLQRNSLSSCIPTLRSTVNRREKIDSLYCNAIPCHPASQRCDPLPTEGKKIDSLYCNAIPCHPAPQPMTCGLILHATSVKFIVSCFHIHICKRRTCICRGGGGGGGGGLTAQGGGADSTGGGGAESLRKKNMAPFIQPQPLPLSQPRYMKKN